MKWDVYKTAQELKKRRKSIYLLRDLPKGSSLWHKHAHTVSQYLSTSRCVHVSGWQVPHSVDSNGHQTSLRSPAKATALLFHLISSTTVCLMSKKTCICSHKIHAQCNRCMWWDNSHTPSVLCSLCALNTFTHSDKLIHPTPSLTTHTGSAGRIDSHHAGENNSSTLSPQTTFVIRLIRCRKEKKIRRIDWGWMKREKKGEESAKCGKWSEQSEEKVGTRQDGFSFSISKSHKDASPV